MVNRSSAAPSLVAGCTQRASRGNGRNTVASVRRRPGKLAYIGGH